jgi:hypothetical protein
VCPLPHSHLSPLLCDSDLAWPLACGSGVPFCVPEPLPAGRSRHRLASRASELWAATPEPHFDARTFWCWWRKTTCHQNNGACPERSRTGCGRGGGFRCQSASASKVHSHRNTAASATSYPGMESSLQGRKSWLIWGIPANGWPTGRCHGLTQVAFGPRICARPRALSIPRTSLGGRCRA